MKGSDATSALFKAMEKGDVYSDKLLPIVGQLMKARASTGIDAARTSSIAEQARAENAQTALLNTFSKNGGEEGFARFWQTITWAMKELDPLVKGMAGLFDRLSVVMQAPVRLFGMLGSTVGYLNQQFGWSEKNIVTFAALGTLLMSKWGRVATVFTGLLIVLEDIAFGIMGKDSLTKRFMEWVEMMTGFDVDKQKGIFALAGALMTAAVAMKAIGSLKKATDILSTGKIPSTVPGGGQKGGVKSSFLSSGKKAGLLAAGAALFMDQQDVYSLTGVGLNPALFQPVNSLSLNSFQEGRDFKYAGPKAVSYSDVMAGINENTVPSPQDILGKMISGATSSKNVTVQNEFVINASDPQGVWQEIEGKIEYSVNKMLNDAYLESGG
mgnify:CR=1 FL=1